MPSRLVTVAIILFWLATTGWMFSREVLPLWQAGEPPPFHLDLAEEVSAHTTNWDVLEQGQKIGTAHTTVRRTRDRNYALQVQFHFHNWSVVGISVDKCSCEYRITPRGELLGLLAQMVLGQNILNLEADIHGEVKGEELFSDISLKSAALGKDWTMELDPMPLSKAGNILNTMHPINRITGLHDGRSWQVPVIDPIELAVSSLPKKLNLPLSLPSLSGNQRNRFLLAEVHAASLPWDEVDIACWRIDFAEPNKTPQARLWVRRSDGLVLQQESSVMGKTMQMKRMAQ